MRFFIYLVYDTCFSQLLWQHPKMQCVKKNILFCELMFFQFNIKGFRNIERKIIIDGFTDMQYLLLEKKSKINYTINNYGNYSSYFLARQLNFRLSDSRDSTSWNKRSIKTTTQKPCSHFTFDRKQSYGTWVSKVVRNDSIIFDL